MLIPYSIIDLIVAEAIHSFELNIALFYEIQELSDSKQLHPTLNKYSVSVSDPKNQASNYTPTTDWLVGFATGVMTLALGLSLYHKISSRS
jgi:hypothetical protein